MPFAFATEPYTQCYRHGGRAVLTVTAQLPTDGTPAGAHLRELILRLLRFAERTHLPAATAELEQAAASGALHGFFSYRYAVNLQKRLCGELPCLDLSATLSRGSTCLSRHTLSTCWSPDLTLQRPPRRRCDLSQENPRLPLAKQRKI